MKIKSFLGNLAKTYLVVGALSVSAYASADNWGYPPQYAPAGAPMCCPPACAPTCCNEPPHCDWGYNPPAYSKCGNGCGNFFDTLGLRVDFLYWRPSVDELALGSEETIIPFVGTPDCCNAPKNRSYVKRPDFSFDAGFRLGVSHFCPSACWDVALNWTHYHNSSSVTGNSANLGLNSTSATTTLPTTPYTLFLPYWEGVDSAYPDFAKGRWKLEADWIDLEIGNKYRINSCFVMRPSLALRGARINQSFHVDSYADRGFATTSSPFDAFYGVSNRFNSEVKAKNYFLAIGPRVGVGLEYDIGCGFAIVGEAAGSILFGRAKKHAKERFNGTFRATGLPIAVNEKLGGTHRDSSRLMSDLLFGIKWDHCFTCCNQSHVVTIAVLWEHHGLFQFNQFDFDSNKYEFVGEPTGDSINRAPHGDIFLQGLTVAFNVGF